MNFFLINKRESRQLNKKFLKHQGETDVITFNYKDEGPFQIYAETFICLDTTLKQAKEYGNDFNSELVLYIIHSILHLIGFNDLKKKEKEKMREKEKEIFSPIKKNFKMQLLSPL